MTRGLDPRWWLKEVIEPTLRALGPAYDGKVARALLLGTALHESGGLWFLRQGGGGPGLGPYQMEPETIRSLWVDYLRYPAQKRLTSTILELAGASQGVITALEWPLAEFKAGLLASVFERHAVANVGARTVAELWWVSTALARARYRWDRRPLPAFEAGALAQYHKDVWNTAAGKADPKVTRHDFETAVRLVEEEP